MRVYHRTREVTAILAEGFRNGQRQYLTDREWRGVWVSDRDLPEHACEAPHLLSLDISEEMLHEYEWIPEDGGLGYREFLVPASLLNRFGPPQVIADAEEESHAVKVNGEIPALPSLSIWLASRSDEPFLRDMFYHSLYVPDGHAPLDRSIVSQPEIAKYVDGWGRPGDVGLIAVDSQEPVGATWMRLFRAPDKGYGYVVTTFRSWGSPSCWSIEAEVQAPRFFGSSLRSPLFPMKRSR